MSVQFAFEILWTAHQARAAVRQSSGRGMGWYWWSELPQTEIMTYPHHGRMHLEVSRDVLDGTSESLGRLAKALGMTTVSASFMSLYASLLLMMQPRPTQ